MTTQPEITQADREAMADLYFHIGRASKRDADNIRAGEWDNTTDMDLFIAHRTKSAAPLVGALCSALEELWMERHSHQDRVSFERDFRSEFAALAQFRGEVG